ncbi:MAG TPA: MaoC family dehydratase [Pseudomonadales bacterium]|nr:MaoC family dehydratase [Pseudomonadales bacterium]
MKNSAAKRVTVSDLPYSMLLESLPTMSAMLIGGAKSVLPFKGDTTGNAAVLRTAKAPSQALLKAFANWCGNSGEVTQVPAPLVCAKITLPVVSELTARSPYPLLSVLNQGIHLRIHKPLPLGEEILLEGRLLDASDDGYRARIASEVVVGTASTPNAIRVEAVAAVPLKPRPAGEKAAPRVEPEFETIGEWQAAANEGQTFFWMTGDFNPIHTVPALAKRTRFKGCIMHGYGAFAQVFSCLERSGVKLTDIEVRFLTPLPLPSPTLLIQRGKTADAEGRRAFRLTDAQGTVYQAGHYLES